MAEHSWLTTCEVPDGVERGFYWGFHLHHARKCLEAGYENNAASWMWRDEAEEDSGFAPVAGTLRVASPHGVTGIEYVDARDVAKLIENSDGGGI